MAKKHREALEHKDTSQQKRRVAEETEEAVGRKQYRHNSLIKAKDDGRF